MQNMINFERDMDRKISDNNELHLKNEINLKRMIAMAEKEIIEIRVGMKAIPDM